MFAAAPCLWAELFEPANQSAPSALGAAPLCFTWVLCFFKTNQNTVMKSDFRSTIDSRVHFVFNHFLVFVLSILCRDSSIQWCFFFCNGCYFSLEIVFDSETVTIGFSTFRIITSVVKLLAGMHQEWMCNSIYDNNNNKNDKLTVLFSTELIERLCIHYHKRNKPLTLLNKNQLKKKE